MVELENKSRSFMVEVVLCIVQMVKLNSILGVEGRGHMVPFRDCLRNGGLKRMEGG
jgi:hypothetical protein